MATWGGFLSVFTAPRGDPGCRSVPGGSPASAPGEPHPRQWRFPASQQHCSWEGPWQTVSRAPALLGSAACETIGSFPPALGPDQDAPKPLRDPGL